MMPDTPATTYHLEFRYGSDVDALAQYNEGPYAYWLAAGFPADADEEMIKNVITLFCEENLAEAAEESADGTSTGAAPESDGEETIEIATAEELAAINDNLSGHYVLTADIDLSGEEWTPIGTYAPSGDSPEEQEIPADESAFTGTFDGQGHTNDLCDSRRRTGESGITGTQTSLNSFSLCSAKHDRLTAWAFPLVVIVGIIVSVWIADVSMKEKKLLINQRVSAILLIVSEI